MATLKARSLAAADSVQVPTRVKMCDGMCCACGASGAIIA